MRILSFLAALAVLCGPVAAQDITIATGRAGLTYAPIGRIIAEGVSAATGLSVRAVESRGSLENVEAIASGAHPTGLAQSDVAFWAQDGSGIWSGRTPLTGLRTIAALYPEQMHLVARADAGIAALDDLRGRRVALDAVGSGTYVEARLVLEAAEFRSDEYAASDLSGAAAAEALERGEIDAFFLVAGVPTAAVADLAARLPVVLVPIEGVPAEDLIGRHGFVEPSLIPEGTYAGVPDTPTLTVGAHWFVGADVPEAVVFDLARGLFDPATLRRLRREHPRGGAISLETALDGVAVPLHEGALRFYEEAGALD